MQYAHTCDHSTASTLCPACLDDLLSRGLAAAHRGMETGRDIIRMLERWQQEDAAAQVEINALQRRVDAYREVEAGITFRGGSRLGSGEKRRAA